MKVAGKKYRLYKGAVQDNGWKTAYKNILDYTTLWGESSSSYYSQTYGVAIKNIGGNSIPEMMLLKKTGDYYAAIEIYTYINGKAVKVKTFDLGFLIAAGMQGSYYVMKNGTMCCVSRSGDEYIREIRYTYYPFKNGRKLKKIKTRKVEFRDPHPYDGTYDWHYMTKMYVDGKFYKKLKSSEAYENAINNADKVTGFSGRAKGLLLTRYGTIPESSVKPMCMTRSEAYAYLQR